jgi:hypothetical protein
MPFRRGEAEAPLPARRHEELVGGVLNHDPSRGRCSAPSRAHESGAFVTPPRGGARAPEVVGDEHEVPKVNGFTERESSAS